MAVAAYDGQGMLAAKGGNPIVIGGNQRSALLEFRANGRVGDGGPFISSASKIRNFGRDSASHRS